MKFLIFFILGFFFFATNVNAQDSLARRAISVELGGIAQVVSLNYDWILAQHKRHFVSARIGLGVEGSFMIAIPHGVTFNFGQKKNYFEAGLLGCLGPTSFGYADASSTIYFLAPVIGYRRHPARGMVFKAFVTTFIPVEENLEVMPYLGISFGWALTKRIRAVK